MSTQSDQSYGSTLIIKDIINLRFPNLDKHSLLQQLGVFFSSLKDSILSNDKMSEKMLSVTVLRCRKSDVFPYYIFLFAMNNLGFERENFYH